MNAKLVEIRKKRVLLSERAAEDVLNLGEFVDKNEDKQKVIRFVLHVAAVMISHSIKQSRRNIPWYRFAKKISYMRYTRNYLFTKLSMQELIWLQNTVLDLEGGSKKKVATESESPDSNRN